MAASYCNPCTCLEMHYRDELSWRKAALTLLCNVWNAISGTTPPTTQAVFEPLVSVLYSLIGAAYGAVEDLPDGTRSVNIVNHTDGDVYVSMDGGATDTYLLGAAESVFVNLYELGLSTTAIIALKQGSFVPTEGLVLIYSIH